MQGNFNRWVYIRTDANFSIGSGHVMRCLTVADALKKEGTDVRFVLSDDVPEKVITGRCHKCHILHTNWQNIEDGAKELAQACDEKNDPLVLIDTYSITSSFVNQLKKHAKVSYLGSKAGDLGNLDLLVNYSFEYDESAYGKIYGKRGTKVLLGPAYSPLRDDFFKVYRNRDGQIQRVLITTGNTDPSGFAPKFMRKALSDDRLKHLAFTLVVGGMVDERIVAEIEDISNNERNVEVLRAVSDMATVMSKCDAAVSANGTTVYELTAAGLPTITFAMVEEQTRSAKSYSRLRNAIYCGHLAEDEEGVVENCADALANLISNPAEAANMARRAHELIDGRGAERIVKELLTL